MVEDQEGGADVTNATRTTAVKVYGSSDDLIEIDGDLSEEIGSYGSPEDGTLVAFSDGTVLRIKYADTGCWEIRREQAGTAQYEHVPHDGDNTTYTDTVTLTGTITWAVCRDQLVRAAGAGRHG